MESDDSSQDMQHAPPASQNVPQYNSIPTQPIDPNTQIPMPAGHVTQPTQMIDSPPRLRSSSPIPDTPARPYAGAASSPSVQVAASSPLQLSTPSTKPIARGALNNGLFANRMAPPGTAFQHPLARNFSSQASQSQSSQWPGQNMTQTDDQDAVRIMDSSDEEDTNNIKPSVFEKSGGALNFTQYAYRSPPKRGDDLASAYGNVRHRQFKSPVQRAPMPAQPVVDMTLEQVPDHEVRQKIKEMRMVLSENVTVKRCYDTLMRCKRNVQDAISRLMEEEERIDRAKSAVVDLTGADDNGGNVLKVADQPRASAKQTVQGSLSMKDKYSVRNNRETDVADILYRAEQAKLKEQRFKNSQQLASSGDSTSPAVARSSEGAQKVRRRLVRGSRPDSPPGSSPVKSASKQVPPVQTTRKPRVIDSDEEEEDAETDDDSAIDDTPEQVINGPLDEKLLQFLNGGSHVELTEACNSNKEMIDIIIAGRPYKSLDEVRQVTSTTTSTTKAGKKKVTTRNIGDKIVDKCSDMFEGYEAVDTLVATCAHMSKPIKPGMKRLGFGTSGSSASGELDAVDIDNAHDSGLGTPLSSASVAEDEKPIAQPAIMNSGITLKNYQVVGVNWLALLHSKGLSGILADDMGLGKTCQIIAFLAHLLEIGETGPHLIIVPGSTVENWMREFSQFCSKLRVFLYYGKQDERLQQQVEIEGERSNINVVVTTYDMAFKKEDAKFFKALKPNVCVFDEGHYLKNAGTQRYKALMKIRAAQRILLTGTPLQNNLQELIALLAFMMPDVFSEHEEALQLIFKHRAKTTDEDHAALLSDERIARARSMMTPFVLRRKKAQVLQHLPEKTNRVEYIDLTEKQRKLYRQIKTEARRVLLNPYADEATKQAQKEKGAVESKKSNIIMRLRQAAIHPLLLRRIYTDDRVQQIARAWHGISRKDKPSLATVVDSLKGMSDAQIHYFCLNEDPISLRRFALEGQPWMDSAKVTALVTQLRQNIAEGARTLIFSQFVTVMDILELVFSTENIKFYRLDGSTRMNERQDLLDAFYADDTPVFMLSTKAGGAGINLACANKVIIFDASFNPQDDIQAENRAHRVGQTRPVDVVRFVARDTIEEQIHALGQSKIALDERVAGDPDDGERKGRSFVEKMMRETLEGEPEVDPEEKEEDEEKAPQVDQTPRKTKPGKKLTQSPTLSSPSSSQRSLRKRKGDDAEPDSGAKSPSKRARRVRTDMKDSFRDGLVSAGLDVA